MGLHKGKGLFSKKSSAKKKLKQIREEIIKEKGANSNHRPVVAIDVSVWEYKALNNPKSDSVVSSEYHAVPKVPVVSVSKAVVAKCKIYNKNGYDVILVLDGTKHPLKDEEHAIRDDSKPDSTNLEDKLADAYNNPDNYSVEDVNKIKKALIKPREDITHEVIRAATENKYTVICAPFEADSQFAALKNQNIIDLVDSIDTDILALGIKRVIQTVAKNGEVSIMEYKKLVEIVLPNEFGHPGTKINRRDLIFYVNMLGN